MQTAPSLKFSTEYERLTLAKALLVVKGGRTWSPMKGTKGVG